MMLCVPCVPVVVGPSDPGEARARSASERLREALIFDGGARREALASASERLCQPWQPYLREFLIFF